MTELETNRSLGPGEEPVVKARYPHMLREDQVVWAAFIEKNELVFDEVWYDVHVGRQMDVPEGSPEWMAAVAAGVSRKRIDVVARLGDVTFIIEVKPIANTTAVGQAATYMNLFVKEFRITGPVSAMVISATVDVDVLDTLREMGVQVIALEGVAL